MPDSPDVFHAGSPGQISSRTSRRPWVAPPTTTSTAVASDQPEACREPRGGLRCILPQCTYVLARLEDVAAVAVIRRQAAGGCVRGDEAKVPQVPIRPSVEHVEENVAQVGGGGAALLDAFRDLGGWAHVAVFRAHEGVGKRGHVLIGVASAVPPLVDRRTRFTMVFRRSARSCSFAFPKRSKNLEVSTGKVTTPAHPFVTVSTIHWTDCGPCTRGLGTPTEITRPDAPVSTRYHDTRYHSRRAASRDAASRRATSRDAPSRGAAPRERRGITRRGSITRRGITRRGTTRETRHHATRRHHETRHHDARRPSSGSVHPSATRPGCNRTSELIQFFSSTFVM